MPCLLPLELIRFREDPSSSSPDKCGISFTSRLFQPFACHCMFACMRNAHNSRCTRGCGAIDQEHDVGQRAKEGCTHLRHGGLCEWPCYLDSNTTRLGHKTMKVCMCNDAKISVVRNHVETFVLGTVQGQGMHGYSQRSIQKVHRGKAKIWQVNPFLPLC